MQIIDEFCSEVMTDMYAYSLRHQMVWVVASTLNVLKSILFVIYLFYSVSPSTFSSALIPSRDLARTLILPLILSMYENRR